ncbi:FAD-dependent oxidoreductase [Bradyrhizobium sp. NP1]|uniref:FAD-dependent oxidoreductase n=1 Tax=Bradyrhizobium sp. NP1 TaxID=3049772 RepID=UPI0025A58077|nr:FAD-dependent oxidoreductase [Bradyrhizobium sp. NP1]WJR79224.1 FAD-dependent oxidoreductase [Bradyrhizobium sp. NP1]
MPKSTGERRLSIAIVGSGPSALFTAEALLESGRNVEVAVIERLPVPFGLVRYGVAPDHAVTKRVTEKMGQTLEDPRVSFFGNVEVGRDVSIDELRERYDAIVLATGASNDAKLGIPGENLPNVFGSARLVSWYNGHPDHADLAPKLHTKRVAIIGMGNVALDIARILSSPIDRLRKTDIAQHAVEMLRTSAVEDVYIVGRGKPHQAKFSYPELRELKTLEGVVAVTDPAMFEGGPQASANKQQKRIWDLFLEFSQNDSKAAPKRINFIFGSSPVRIEGREYVEKLTLNSTQGIASSISCGLVVTAIGYRSSAILGVPFDAARMIVPNQGGQVGDQLFAVGWLGRGPSGVIGTNKPDAVVVAQSILDIGPKAVAPSGSEGLYRLLEARKLRVVRQQSLKRIHAAEVGRGKLVRIADMLLAAAGP